MTEMMFLPGIIAPASMRYAALLEHLPEGTAVTKELEVYASAEPPPGYSIELEIDGILNAADMAGFDRFHLYGHSGGGAIALAFAAAHPDRLLSLALDEPASDHTADDHADPYWDEIDHAGSLPVDQAMREFMRLQLAPGVEPPAPPPAPPSWMFTRPAGIRAFTEALPRHQVDPDRYRAFRAPVLFTRGTLSHPRWIAMEARLGALFADFRAEVFEGLHHLNTSHQAQPGVVAGLLRELWARAEA